MPPARSRALDILLGVRFFAALHVALFHYGSALFASAPWPLQNFRNTGFLCTDLFFVLSGFVLMHLYGDKVSRGALDLRGFWIRRFARLYPSYGLALALLVPIALHPLWQSTVFTGHSAAGKTATFLAHATMLQAWIPALAQSWNIPGWSLSNEAFFYFVFPFAALWLLRRPSSTRWTRWLIIFWMTSLVLPSIYGYLAPDGLAVPGPHSDGVWLTVLKFNPLARLPEFLFGMVLARVTATAAPRPALARLALGVGCMGMVLIVLAGERIPYPLLHNGLALPLLGAVIHGLVHTNGPLSQFLASRPLLVLGRASYPLYIFQLPLRAWLELALGNAVLESAALPAAATLVFILAFALVSSRWIEPVLQKWMEGRLTARFRPQAQPVAAELLVSRG